MSLKKDIYLAISEAIKADPVLRNKFKTFRLFNNQFDNEPRENAFLYPAVFMQYENIDYLPTTGGSQQGDLLATFHVGVESLKTEDLAVFDLLDDLFIFITDLKLGFTRTRELQDINHDNIQVWQQSYKITMTDETANIAARRDTTIIVTLDTEKEIIIDPLSVSGVRSDNNFE